MQSKSHDSEDDLSVEDGERNSDGLNELKNPIDYEEDIEINTDSQDEQLSSAGNSEKANLDWTKF